MGHRCRFPAACVPKAGSQEKVAGVNVTDGTAGDQVSSDCNGVTADDAGAAGRRTLLFTSPDVAPARVKPGVVKALLEKRMKLCDLGVT
jgi:hypothetical protein